MKNVIRTILMEQTDNFIIVPASDYVELLDKYDDVTKFAYKKLTSNPEDKGKKIWIKGNLNVRDRDIEDLYGIIHVDGNLDISNTKILDLQDITVKGYTSDGGTPRARIRLKKIKQAKLRESQENREINAWDLNNPDIDDVGILANAVFEYFTNHHNVRVKTDEDVQKLEELYNKMDELLLKEKEYEAEGKDLTDIHMDIQVTEDEINEINQSIDVYNFLESGSHYRLTSFELVSDDEYDGWQFAAGSAKEADQSLEEYFDEWMDNPKEYFSNDTLRSNLDEEAIEGLAREYFEQSVREYPEGYFDRSDFELSDDEEEELENLKNELSEYEERLEMESDDSPEYELIQNHIDDLNERIEELEEKNSEVTEEMIDEKIDDLTSDAMNDPANFLDELGLDYSEYIDKDSLLEDLVRDSDYGTLNHYDGRYDEVKILGTYYIVMNTNQ